ncbi:hypothetical protein LT493_44335 [Streptomyces tricolor]|nr:hypothetical protein [Streptomyces tricolor]
MTPYEDRVAATADAFTAAGRHPRRPGLRRPLAPSRPSPWRSRAPTRRCGGPPRRCSTAGSTGSPPTTPRAGSPPRPPGRRRPRSSPCWRARSCWAGRRAAPRRCWPRHGGGGDRTVRAGRGVRPGGRTAGPGRPCPVRPGGPPGGGRAGGRSRLRGAVLPG